MPEWSQEGIQLTKRAPPPPYSSDGNTSPVTNGPSSSATATWNGGGGAGGNEHALETRNSGSGAAYLKVPDSEPDNVSLRSGISVTERETMDRETWGKKIDFLLSVIGFAVDLANVWRFPYLCFKNGGGVFLIPYIFMLLFAGIPLFYMELCLGQYYRQGAITTWGRVCPLFKGIGYCVVMIAFYTDFFYNVIIAWSLHFFFASFTTSLPWSLCNQTWNSENCYQPSHWADLTGENASRCAARINMSIYNNSNRPISAADEYYYKKVLNFMDKDNSLLATVEHPGNIRWELALCLLAVYLICYFSLWKGIKMSGKVVWFTAVFPYIVLFSLLIRGVTLPGAMDGIKWYLTPNISKLEEGQVWIEAATQVFFSLGPGFGVLLAFSSYNKFHNNVYYDAIITSTINCCTSFLAGFVIFSVLGYMSCKSGQPIEEVAKEGPGLVFVVYPEAIATMPGSTFWSLLFFMMLLTLGLDSSFGGSEAIITGLGDEFPIIRRHREIFVALLFSVYMIMGFLMVSQGGLLFVEFMSHYAASWGLLIAVFFETMVISWIYGLKRFASDIREMLGFEPGFYWRFCWAFMGPAFLVYNLIYGFVTYQPLSVQGYVYPQWMNVFGWFIGFSSASAIPIVGVYKLITAPGATLREKFRFTLTPWKEQVELATPKATPRIAGKSIRNSKVDITFQCSSAPGTPL